LRALATKLCDYFEKLIIELNACHLRFVISAAYLFWIGADLMGMHSKLACLKKRRSVLKMTGRVLARGPRTLFPAPARSDTNSRRFMALTPKPSL
jgi:hypothetical protein